MKYFIIPFLLNTVYGLLSFYEAPAVLGNVFYLFMTLTYNWFLNAFLVVLFANRAINKGKNFWLVSLLSIFSSVAPPFVFYIPFVIRDGLATVISETLNMLNEALIIYYSLVTNSVIIAVFLVFKLIQVKVIPFVKRKIKKRDTTDT